MPLPISEREPAADGSTPYFDRWDELYKAAYRAVMFGDEKISKTERLERAKYFFDAAGYEFIRWVQVNYQNRPQLPAQDWSGVVPKLGPLIGVSLATTKHPEQDRMEMLALRARAEEAERVVEQERLNKEGMRKTIQVVREDYEERLSVLRRSYDSHHDAVERVQLLLDFIAGANPDAAMLTHVEKLLRPVLASVVPYEPEDDSDSWTESNS